MCLSVRKGSVERLSPSKAPGAVEEASYQHSRQTRSSLAMNTEKLEVPRVEKLIVVSVWFGVPAFPQSLCTPISHGALIHGAPTEKHGHTPAHGRATAAVN